MATIAFDLDGTLIDSAPHIHAVVTAALSDCALQPITPDAARAYVGRGVSHFVDRLCADEGHDRTTTGAQIEARMMHHYATLPTDPDTLYPGVLGALDTLRAANHQLALCTNKPTAPTQGVLRDTPLSGYFETVICGDSLATRKPAPEMLQATGATLYVGDSEVDAETAEAAHVPFLLFTEGYRKTPADQIPQTARFANFAELPGLVATVLSSSCQ